MRFFLVDRVDELKPGEIVRGVKNITLSDEILQDHFPENPVFPGTLIVEALAQIGGFLIEVTFNRDKDNVRRAVLGQIKEAKFYEPVKPGDQLELRCALSSTLDDAAQVEGEAHVRGRRVARATLTFVMRTVVSDKVHQQRREIYKIWTRELKPEFPIL
jgi:3-hydroxyacyl-[acyl-carrier-protein] dehydratase